MEKSGKLLLTKEEYDSFINEHFLPQSVIEKGVTSYSMLSEIIRSGEFEIVGNSL